MQNKTMKQVIPWMPLSANLFRLESSSLTRAKQASNRNNVAIEKRVHGLLAAGQFAVGQFTVKKKLVSASLG